MKRYSLYALQQLETPPVLHIHSIEGDIYTADCVLSNGERALIVRDDGQALSGQSLSALHALLAGIRFSDTLLIQRSAYDEMIGTSTFSGPTALRLNWTTQTERQRSQKT